MTQTTGLIEAVSQALPESTKRLLLALAKVGGPMEIVAPMLDIAGVKLRADHRRFLTGPIVQYENSWRETTPRWFYEQIPYERLQIVLDDHEHDRTGWTVGPAEIAAVMYPATMEAPLNHGATELYLWAAGHAVAKRDRIPIDDVREQHGFPPDSAFLEASGSLRNHFVAQATEIRHKVVKHQKERERATRSLAPQLNTSPPVDVADQFELF